MKAVLDTNVLISAVIQPRGASRAVLEAWTRGEFISVTSRELLAEVERGLAYPRVQRRLHWTDEQRLLFVARLFAGSERVVPDKLHGHIVEGDPDDDVLFATALAGGAETIATGDRQVLAVRSYEGIDVITPRDFVAILRRRR